MASNSHQSDQNLNDKQRGKRPMEEKMPSENSRSPPSKKNDATRPHTTPLRLSRGRKYSKVVTSKLRRSIDFPESSGQTNTTKTSSLPRNSYGVARRIDRMNEMLAKVDKLFKKIAGKFTPEALGHEVENNDPPVEESAAIHINVNSGTVGDHGVEYTMTPENDFQSIYDDYSERLDYGPEKIRLIRGLRSINPLETAEDVGLQDGDMLVARGMDFEMNTNTNMKRLKIQQLKDDKPAQLNLTLPLNEPIEDIYQRWSEHVGYPLNIFNLVYNELKIPKFGTIEDCGIKNEGNMHCVKKMNAAI